MRNTQVSIQNTLHTEADNSVLLRIQDGIGCIINSVNTGFGLPGMRERIKFPGCQFIATSSPGQGMLINASIPLP